MSRIGGRVRRASVAVVVVLRHLSTAQGAAVRPAWLVPWRHWQVLTARKSNIFHMYFFISIYLLKPSQAVLMSAARMMYHIRYTLWIKIGTTWKRYSQMDYSRYRCISVFHILILLNPTTTGLFEAFFDDNSRVWRSFIKMLYVILLVS